MSRVLSCWAATVGVLWGASAPVLAIGSPANAGVAISPIGGEVLKHFEVLEKIRREGGDPEKLLRYMYWPDVIIDGSGSSKTYKDLADAMPDMKAIVASMHGKCGYDFRYPTVASPNLVVVFGGVECQEGDRPPVRTKAMWVWLKRGTDWKIIREVYVMEPLK